MMGAAKKLITIQKSTNCSFNNYKLWLKLTLTKKVPHYAETQRESQEEYVYTSYSGANCRYIPVNVIAPAERNFGGWKETSI